MDKKKLLKNLLTISTLILPTFAYLVINTLFFSVTPTVSFHEVEKDDLAWHLYEDDTYFVYATKDAYTVSGEFITHDGGRLGVVVDVEDVIGVGTKYFRLEIIDEVVVLSDVKLELFKEKTSYAIPLSMIITLLGAFIATLVVFKKMHYAFKYPKVSVLISLVTITIVLAIINMIVKDLYYVFLVFTISWGVYMLEGYILDGGEKEKTATQAQNQLMQQLSMLAKNFK